MHANPDLPLGNMTMHRLRFQLWHLLSLTALICLVCAAWVNVAHKHRILHEQLERFSSINAEDWDVKQLVEVLQADYGIHVAVKKRFMQQKLHDWELDGISLKNSIHILLASANLSFTTNYTDLTIVELEESSDWKINPVYRID